MKKPTTRHAIVASVCLFMIMSVQVSAQFYDPFSDGNYTSNPAWDGDTARFKVNTQHQLQTRDTTAGRAYLSTPANLSSLSNIQWSFYIHLGFPPSANNNARVYLTSDSANLENGLHGYFLQFGEALSLDAVELFRQDDTVITSVCRGNDGEIATAFYLGVKVTRDSTGFWQLFVDTLGGTNYILEASATDNTYNTSEWFGVVCRYTTSNAVSFYYDNFNVSSSLCNIGVTSSSTDVLCFGDSTGTASIQPVGGLAPYSYSWSPGGQSISLITGLPAGNYTGTVIDINLCTSVAEISIEEPPQLMDSIAATNATCNGGSDGMAVSMVQGGTPPYSYLWSPAGGNADTAFNLPAGGYTLTVTDSVGCTAVANTAIAEPPAVIITFSGTPASCSACCDGEVFVNVTGGTPPYSYQWSNGETSLNLDSLCADTLTLTVLDANGCTMEDSTVVFFSTGISKQISDAKIQIYPNPAGEFIIVSSPSGIAGMEIYNMIGILTGSFVQLNNKPAQSGMRVDVTGLVPGVYFVRVINGQNKNGNEFSIQRFVKQ